MDFRCEIYVFFLICFSRRVAHMGYEVTIRMGESGRVRWEGKGWVVFVLDGYFFVTFQPCFATYIRIRWGGVTRSDGKYVNFEPFEYLCVG